MKMFDTDSRHIRTGADPRSLPDFAALREEMGKLTHPARPDVDWVQVESLSLALFKQNGVELQTAAWYTLARSYLARVSGMNEGLTILNALLSHQWIQLWPQQTHARAEIISGLSQRLQKTFRTFTLGHDDLHPLYEAEKLLRSLDDILGRQELKQVCQLAPLIQQICGATTRLENSAPQSMTAPAIALPEQALVEQGTTLSSPPESRLVYVIRPEPEVNVEVIHDVPPPPKRWPIFAAGMLSAFLVSGATWWVNSWLHKTDVAVQALTDSVASLPRTLTTDELQTLKRSDKLPQDANGWLKQASTQLDAVAALPHDWQQQYAGQLIRQAEVLWPDNAQVAELKSEWQQKMAMETLPNNALNGWHDGMQQLQALSDKLNALDGQKGKYITVSELKSAVFGMMTSFRQTVPVEEQLRQAQEQATPVQIQQLEQHISGLSVALGNLTQSSSDR
jgi:type VI secretion system protein VasL